MSPGDGVAGGRGSHGKASDFLTRAASCLLCPFSFHVNVTWVKSFAVSGRLDPLVFALFSLTSVVPV